MSPFNILRAKRARALPLISASVGGALADGCNWVAQKVKLALSVAASIACCSLTLCFARAFACRGQVRACSRYAIRCPHSCRCRSLDRFLGPMLPACSAHINMVKHTHARRKACTHTRTHKHAHKHDHTTCVCAHKRTRRARSQPVTRYNPTPLNSRVNAETGGL